MVFNGRNVDFPAVPKISFSKLFDSFKTLVNEKDVNISNYAKNMLALKDEYPFLYDGFDDLDILEKHKEVIQKLIRVLFPDVLTTNEIKAIMPPFNFYPIHYSKRFKNIMDAAGDDYEIEVKGYDEDSMFIYGCTSILNMYYKYPIDTSSHTLLDIPDKHLNIVKTYKVTFNADMMEFFPTEKAVDISYEDYLQLLDNFENIDFWKEKFPPGSWIMRGIGVTNLVDVTMDASLSDITTNLIIKTIDSFDKIEQSIKRLFKIHNLKIGFVNYENDSFYASHKGNISGVMLGKNELLKCSDTLCNHSYHQLIDLKKPLVIPDVDNFDSASHSGLSKILKKSKLKSYIISPLIYNDELSGFLEIGASKTYQLSNALLNKLDLVLPIISMAASRFKTEERNNIEAIIQQECTTIHPSVKWRFEEEAKKYLYKQLHNNQANFNDIIFKDVIPLYGQLDIRESSNKRNEAVKHDLLKQIEEALSVLHNSNSKLNLPILDALIYQIENQKRELNSGVFAGSEHKILSFLKGEVYPVFQHIKNADDSLSELVDDYFKLLDPEFESIYEKRRDFDESVMKVNYTLANFLDEKQKGAQKMFPHYFERYKTDGVEYNIYIGQSIANNVSYNPIHLYNLQLWQLQIMCEMEFRFKELQKELRSPLEIASLILIYSSPLAVHFRMDEKKFDVEGAYNARYEIVKKRIDKAFIKGTNERITEPGKITIVYSREQDALEYRKYIQFLQFKGYLKASPVEDHPLEDLQGITGLRALRVEVDYSKTTKPDELFDVNEFMEAIERQN